MKNEKGFTLIEILVVVGVFSGLVSLLVGVFLTNQELQRRTMAIQRTMSDTSYAIEHISRAIRMAQNDEDGDCLNYIPEDNKFYTFNYSDSDAKSDIIFIDYDGRCVRFFLEEGRLKKRITDDGTTNTYNLTSKGVDIKEFITFINVYPDGASGEIYEDQPSVTLFFDLEAKRLKGDGSWWDARVQTTVTRRKLDLERSPD